MRCPDTSPGRTIFPNADRFDVTRLGSLLLIRRTRLQYNTTCRRASAGTEGWGAGRRLDDPSVAKSVNTASATTSPLPRSPRLARRGQTRGERLEGGRGGVFRRAAGDWLEAFLVHRICHFQVEAGEAFGHTHSCERSRHVGVWHLHVGKVRFPEATTENLGGLRKAEVARSEQLAHDRALPVTRNKRARSRLSDIVRGDHRHGQIGANHVGGNALLLHAVMSGTCRLEMDGLDPVDLHAGDFALVPHGEGHRMVSASGIAAPGLFDLPRELVNERYEILRCGGGGGLTQVICSAVRLDHPAARSLIAILPPMIRLQRDETRDQSRMDTLLRILGDEAEHLQPGGETIITRLADAIVIQAMRAWFARETGPHAGWLGALADVRIGRAVALILQDPARPWTVASLASHAGISRSGFAARFVELVGEPPASFLTRWRMHLATASLREEDATVGELAFRLGYQSEPAFSRAFKRVMGVPPSTLRRTSG